MTTNVNDTDYETFITEADARKQVEQACQRFGLTLKEFAYAHSDYRGGRLLIAGDYIPCPRQVTPLKGAPEDPIFSPDIHLAILVVSGTSEKMFTLFGAPPIFRYGTIRDYFEPYFEEWIVYLMTGSAS